MVKFDIVVASLIVQMIIVQNNNVDKGEQNTIDES